MTDKEKDRFKINDIIFRKELSFGNPYEEEIFRVLKSAFEEIFDMFDINIFVIDEFGYYHFVNKKYCKVANKTKKDIVGRHISEVLPQSDVKRYFIGKDILLAKDSKYKGKYKESQPYVNSSGEAFLFDTKKFQLNNAYGKSFNTGDTRLFLGVGIDIIDLEYREADLKNLIERINKLNKKNQDSLNHAWRIQEASLPSQEYFSSCFPESFILHKPRDTVSGDFYRLHQTEHEKIIAIGDCTGHGMPGALLSMLGVAALNEIVKGNHIYEPEKILEELDNRISRDLNSKPGEPGKCENPPLDGMDISICRIDSKNKIFNLSLANTVAYLIKNNQLIELKGESHTIGSETLFYDKIEKKFQSYYLPIEEGDVLYLFTDGYTSQFGGNKEKGEIATKFLRSRFKKILQNIYQKPFEEQKQIIEEHLENRKGENNQVDDILIFGTKLSVE